MRIIISDDKWHYVVEGELRPIEATLKEDDEAIAGVLVVGVVLERIPLEDQD